jgi:hypothetical protein
MPYHYCANVHAPLLFAGGPYPCTTCAQQTLPAHDVVRFAHPTANYTVRWHDTGDNICLKVVFGSYIVLLSDDVLKYDTATIDQDTLLNPPGGGNWTDNTLPHRGGGWPRGSIIPGCLKNVKVALGRHGPAPQYGLVHVLSGHPSVFNDLRSPPPKNTPFSLVNLRDNLRNMTAPRQQGVGALKVATQQNGNTAVHGVSKTIHAFMVVNKDHMLVTGYSSNVSAGTLNLRVTVRTWD